MRTEHLERPRTRSLPSSHLLFLCLWLLSFFLFTSRGCMGRGVASSQHFPQPSRRQFSAGDVAQAHSSSLVISAGTAHVQSALNSPS